LKQNRVYKTGTAFRTALEDRLAKIAMSEEVDLQRIRRQVAFDRLLADLKEKGEVSCQGKGPAARWRYLLSMGTTLK